MQTNSTVPLVTCRTPNEAATAAALPKRLKVLSWGENKSTRGPVVLNDYSAGILPLRQSAEGYAEIAIDFEHNTCPGSDEFARTQEPRPVAGYGRPVLLSGDGLYLEDIRWTPRGETEARNYIDLSPAIQLNDSREVSFVHSVALTRNGAVEGLHFCSAAAGAAPTANTNTPKKRMPELETTVASMQKGLDTIMDRLSALEKKAPPVLDETKLTALSARLDSLEKASQSALQAQEEKERNAILDAANRDGKVIPLSAEAVKTIPLTALREMVEKITPTIPLSARQPKPAEKTDNGLKGLARVAAAINNQFAKA